MGSSDAVRDPVWRPAPASPKAPATSLGLRCHDAMMCGDPSGSDGGLPSPVVAWVARATTGLALIPGRRLEVVKGELLVPDDRWVGLDALARRLGASPHTFVTAPIRLRVRRALSGLEERCPGRYSRGARRPSGAGRRHSLALLFRCPLGERRARPFQRMARPRGRVPQSARHTWRPGRPSSARGLLCGAAHRQEHSWKSWRLVVQATPSRDQRGGGRMWGASSPPNTCNFILQFPCADSLPPTRSRTAHGCAGDSLLRGVGGRRAGEGGGKGEGRIVASERP